MRRLLKLVGIILVILLVMFITPWSVGFTIKKLYNYSVAHYNAQKKIIVELKSFNRGWITSQAQILIKIIDPTLIQIAERSGITNPQLIINVSQKIKHGPVFLNKETSHFGLAAIQNEINFSPDLQKLIKANEMKSHDLVTLMGNYIFNFNLPILEYRYQNVFFLQAPQGIQGKIVITSMQDHFIVDTKISSLKLNQENAYAVDMSGIKLLFDQYNSGNGLWLGKTNIVFSDFHFKNSINNQINLSEASFTDILVDASDQLQSINWINVKNANINNEKFGPLFLQLKVSGLNKNAAANILNQKIINQQGFFDFTDIQTKMASLAPTLFSQNFIIAMQTLQLTTPEGMLLANGFLTWPHKVTNAKDVADALSQANVDVNLTVAKNLTFRLINYLPLFPILKSDNMSDNDLINHWQSNFNELLSHGFVFEDEDGYHIIIKKRIGRLRLNGKLLYGQKPHTAYTQNNSNSHYSNNI